MHFKPLRFLGKCWLIIVFRKVLSIIRVKNESYKVTAKCKDLSCKWMLHMSYASELDRFVIKTYNSIYKCSRINWCNDVSAAWIARTYGSLIRTNSNVTVRILQEIIHTNQGLEVLRCIIYIGKRIALRSIRGDHKIAYAELYKHTNAARKYNQGLFAFVKCSMPLDFRGPIFKRFYHSFAA